LFYTYIILYKEYDVDKIVLLYQFYDVIMQIENDYHIGGDGFE
jgi:hypothetical protein